MKNEKMRNKVRYIENINKNRNNENMNNSKYI